MSNALLVAALFLNSTPAYYDSQYGVATYYSFQDYGYGPLFSHPFETYDPENGLQWCAMAVSEYVSGAVQPGDWIVVEFVDEDRVEMFQAWDAGPFGGYYVGDLPILVDIPQHLWPVQGAMSARVNVINLSRLQREGRQHVN